MQSDAERSTLRHNDIRSSHLHLVCDMHKNTDTPLITTRKQKVFIPTKLWEMKFYYTQTALS